jgi:uncharacterized protein YndB with AHSA1/START domain
MTLTDTTDREQSDTLRFEFDLPHAPAKVWRALSEPALLSRWLLPITALDLTPGAPFTFRRDPMPGWDGVVNCTVLEVEPGRRLRYGWVVGELDTVVEFTLAETASGTKLSLVQSGFREHQKQNFGGARYGWRQMGGALGQVLAELGGAA